MNDEYYMRMALREASLAAEEGEVPIGAVIVAGLGEKEQRVVAKGHNMTERLSDPTAHAEMIALTGATSAIGGKYLHKCTLYVTVEPCPMCAAALSPGRTDRIWRSGPKKGLQPVLSPASAPEDRSQQRSA